MFLENCNFKTEAGRKKKKIHYCLQDVNHSVGVHGTVKRDHFCSWFNFWRDLSLVYYRITVLLFQDYVWFLLCSKVNFDFMCYFVFYVDVEGEILLSNRKYMKLNELLVRADLVP